MSAVFVDSPLGSILRNGIQEASVLELASSDEDTESQSVRLQLWLLPSRPGLSNTPSSQHSQPGMASWKIVLIVILPLFLLIIPGICMVIYIRRRRERNLARELNLDSGGPADGGDSMVSKPDSHVLDQKRLEDFPLITLTEDNIRELTGRAVLTGLLHSSRVTEVPPVSDPKKSHPGVINDDEKSLSNLLGGLARVQDQAARISDDIPLEILNSEDIYPARVKGGSPTNPSLTTTALSGDYPLAGSIFEPLDASSPPMERSLAGVFPPSAQSGHVSESESASLDGEIRRATTLRRAPAYSISRVHTFHLARAPTLLRLRVRPFKSIETAESLSCRNSTQIQASDRSVMDSLYKPRPRKVKSMVSYSPLSGEARQVGPTILGPRLCNMSDKPLPRVDQPAPKRTICSSSQSTDQIYSQLLSYQRSLAVEYPQTISDSRKSKRSSPLVSPSLRTHVASDQQLSLSTNIPRKGHSWPANLHRAAELLSQRGREQSGEYYTRLLSSKTIPNEPFDSDNEYEEEDDQPQVEYAMLPIGRRVITSLRPRVGEILPRSEPYASIEMTKNASIDTTDDHQRSWSGLESSANSTASNRLGKRADSRFSLCGYSASGFSDTPAGNTTMSVGTSSDRLHHYHHQQQLQQQQCASDPLLLSSSGSFSISEGKESNPICIICLETLDIGDTIRQLPCGHVYHPPCIDVWLTQKSVQCPLCKYDCQAHVDALLSHANSTMFL
ncbi:hypothetical protein IWQ61_010243 [Dispira simplex]|nr:hypothetical protein IWQ61_010243 [Dispira simplex]